MGVETALGIASLAVGLIGAVSNKPSTPTAASAPAPAAPTAAPQAAKLPDAGATLAGQQGTGQAGGAPGVAQTFLSGIGGVDPSTLSLGKGSTLLGA